MSLPVFALLAASILWGLSWMPLKWLYAAGFDGVSLIICNFGLLSLVMTPTLLFQRQQWRNDKSKLLLIGLLGGAANVAFAYALIYGDVVRVMVLFYLLPIWGVLGGRLLLREQVDIWRWLGVILAIGGAFIVLGAFSLFTAPPGWIDLIAIASGFFLAMNNLSFRAVQSVPVGSKVAAMFYGCLLLGLLALYLSPEAYRTGDTLAAWGGMLSYALLWLLAASLVGQWAVTRLESGRSSIIIITELLAAVVSATLIRGEMPSHNELIGGTFILIAALIEALRDVKADRSRAQSAGL